MVHPPLLASNMGKKYNIEWIKLGNKDLALNPATGDWLLLDERCRKIIDMFEQGKSASELVQAFPEVKPDEIAHLFSMLNERDFRSVKNTGSAHNCKSCSEGHFPNLAILNLTEKCNLRCTYCYVDAGCKNVEDMKPETAFRIVDEMLAMNPNNKPCIVMHGGEPLVHYELVKALAEYCEPFKDKLILSIQTNATLIDDEKALFLKKHNVSVGVSIDGTREFHDCTRPFANGTGSFSQVMKGIRVLRKNGVQFGAISVLNAQNASHIDEVVDFFIENEIYSMSFIPFQRFGRGKDDVDSYVNGPMMFEAYKKIIDRIVKHNSEPNVKHMVIERMVKEMTRNVVTHAHDFMCMRAPCGSGHDILGFGTNGDFYMCDDFIGDPDFRIGGLNEGSVKSQILGSALLKEKGKRFMEDLPRCRACEYRSLCGGVCHSLDYYTGANGVETLETCEFYKLMIPYLIQRIAEDPNFAGLLDPELKNGEEREFIFSIKKVGDDPNSIDKVFFETLLTVHDVKTKDSVSLCCDEAEECQDLLPMFKSLADKNVKSRLIIRDGDFLGSTSFRKFFQSEILDVQIQLNEVPKERIQDCLYAVKDFMHCRNGSRLQNKVLFMVPLDLLRNEDFLLFAERDLLENDEILVSRNPDETCDINDAVDCLRERKLKAKIYMSCDRDKLNLDNLFFVLEKNNSSKVVLIDKDHLAGVCKTEMPEKFFT